MKEGRAQLVWAKNNFVEQLLAGTIFKNKQIFIRKQFTLPGRKTRWSVFWDAQLPWWQRLERYLPAGPFPKFHHGVHWTLDRVVRVHHIVFIPGEGKTIFCPKGCFLICLPGGTVPTSTFFQLFHENNFRKSCLQNISHVLVLFAFYS